MQGMGRETGVKPKVFSPIFMLIGGTLVPFSMLTLRHILSQMGEQENTFLENQITPKERPIETDV